MNQRRFAKAQKVDLWLASTGKCCICRISISSDWHADHIIPYAKGGQTVLSNGQSLCPKCNLSKGAKMPDINLPEGIELRSWQIDFDAAYAGALSNNQKK